LYEKTAPEPDTATVLLRSSIRQVYFSLVVVGPGGVDKGKVTATDHDVSAGRI